MRILNNIEINLKLIRAKIGEVFFIKNRFYCRKLNGGKDKILGFQKIRFLIKKMGILKSKKITSLF